jgi:hypothetical protein
MSGNKEVAAWFEDHQLPFTKDIVHNLDCFGVTTVEDLKLYTARDVAELFGSEKTIIKRKAEIAWRHLGGIEDFEFKKKAATVPLEAPTTPPPPPRTKHPRTKHGNPHQMHKNRCAGYSEGHSLNHFGFTSVVKDTKEDIKRAREGRSAAKEARSKGTVIDIDVEETPLIPDNTG